MLRVLGVVDDKYRVLDTDDGVEDLVSAEDLVLNISIGVEFNGCEYGPKGLLVQYEGVEPYDVDIEVWKPVWFIQNDVEVYTDFYEVSNLGHVRKLAYVDGVIKYFYPRTSVLVGGYIRVTLYLDGEKYNCFVHRLVAYAFIPNPNKLPQVNHRDEVPGNNCAYNLEWCTQAYNNNYGTRCARMSESMKKPVRKYAFNGKLLCEYTSCLDAALASSCSASIISHCCLGYMVSAAEAVWRSSDDDELFVMDECERRSLFKLLRQRRKEVRKYSLEGVFISGALLMTSAANSLNVPVDSVRSCCVRRRGSSGGFTWRFADYDELADRPGNRALIEEFYRQGELVAGVESCSQSQEKLGKRGRKGVRQYSLDGMLVAEYESVTQAARSLDNGKSLSDISSICRRVDGRVICKGFIFRFTDTDDLMDLSVEERRVAIDSLLFDTHNGGSVRKYTLSGLFIGEFSTLSEVRRLFGSNVHQGAYRCCVGISASSKGFIWRYSSRDDFADRPENRALIEEFHRKQSEKEG